MLFITSIEPLVVATAPAAEVVALAEALHPEILRKHSLNIWRFLCVLRRRESMEAI